MSESQIREFREILKAAEGSLVGKEIRGATAFSDKATETGDDPPFAQIIIARFFVEVGCIDVRIPRDAAVQLMRDLVDALGYELEEPE